MSARPGTAKVSARKSVSRAGRSRIMAAIRKADTGPELIVRRALRSLDYHFRTHVGALPGSPDIVVPAERTAIFVHGCFWHQHRRCGKATTPKVRQSYWRPKLLGNVVRDRKVQRKLRRAGWHVLVIWECKTKDYKKLQRILRQSLSGHRISRSVKRPMALRPKPVPG